MRGVRNAEDDLHEHDTPEEHPGGGRFKRLLLVVVIGVAMVVGAVAIEGIRSAGVSAPSTSTQAATTAPTSRATKLRSKISPQARCGPNLPRLSFHQP
jgi:hypothetical protein